MLKKGKNENEEIVAIIETLSGLNDTNVPITIKTNGKSKVVEDFNILAEYNIRYEEDPSILRVVDENGGFFNYKKFKSYLDKEFEYEIIFSDTYFNLNKNIYLPVREIIDIKGGYILDLFMTESINLYDNPKISIKMSENDLILDRNTILCPKLNSKKRNKSIEKKIFDLFKKSKIKEYNQNMIGMISVDGQGELYVKDFIIDKNFKIDDLDLHYGDDFKKFSDELFKKLKGDRKGLVLLHGESGTGKTFFLRYLLQKLSTTDKKILYFPPTMVETITEPSFFNFITNWTINNGKNCVLLIEDAEPLLLSRDNHRNMGITNLLNLTDGILNDILSIQIIATFNTSLNELDKALLRPERLIARKNFTKLSIKNTKILLEKIGAESEEEKEMTLAEIYSIKNKNDILIHGIDKTKNSKIGFKTATKNN